MGDRGRRTWDVCPAADEITQAFGCTDYNREWKASWCAGGYIHAGVDLGSFSGLPLDTALYATRNGVVADTGSLWDPHNAAWTPYLGEQAVVIKTDDDGVYVEYATATWPWSGRESGSAWARRSRWRAPGERARASTFVRIHDSGWDQRGIAFAIVPQGSDGKLYGGICYFDGHKFPADAKGNLVWKPLLSGAGPIVADLPGRIMQE